MNYPTQEELKKYLIYVPETGVFINRITRHAKAKEGHVAGYVNPGSGYRYIYLDGLNLLEHRLAWIYVFGILPEGQIDHANGDRTDNRLENLRHCNAFENARNKRAGQNNTSGVKGVSWCASRRKWEASIKMNGKRVFSKRFDSLQEAERAVQLARSELHKEFARHA